MEFITNINKKEYDDFLIKESQYNHFLQSSMWAEVKETESSLSAEYVGVKKDNKLIATALLLKKKLPLNYCYYYSPRGFIIDWDNKNLVEYFTTNIKNYVKKNKGIFIKLDPQFQKDEIIKYNILKENKYKHLGFNLNFERSQPRFTFRIDLNKSLDDIFNNFDSDVKRRIKKADRYHIDCYEGTIEDINKFNELMIMTEKRKDFFSHDSNYYRSFLKAFKTNAKLFFAEIDIEKSIAKINQSIHNLNENCKSITGTSKKENNEKNNIDKKIKDLTLDIEKLKALQENHSNNAIISTYIIAYYDTKAWVLYGANNGDFMFTCGNYSLYYHHIKTAKNIGITTYDLFGCTSKDSTNINLKGLYEFKKKFGGKYTEFIGEFDLVTNKLMYFIFTKLIPIYRKITKKRLHKKNLSE